MPWWRQSSNDQAAQLFEQGQQLVHQGRLMEALPLFERCVALRPNDDQAWSYYGWVLLDLERSEEAVAALNNATKHAPINVAAWYNQALALRQLGRGHEALVCIDRALELDPSNGLSWYQKGVILGGEERAEQIERVDEQHFAAFDAFTQAVAFQPDDGAAWLRRGRLAWRIAHSVQARERLGIDLPIGWQTYLQAALESFDHALVLEPDDPATLFDKGRALKDFGYDHEAREVYRRLVQVANHPTDWYQLALVNNALDDVAETLDSLDHALALDPALRERAAGDFAQLRHHAAFVRLLGGM